MNLAQQMKELANNLKTSTSYDIMVNYVTDTIKERASVGETQTGIDVVTPLREEDGSITCSEQLDIDVRALINYFRSEGFSVSETSLSFVYGFRW